MRDNFRADYTYDVVNDNLIAIVDLDQSNHSVTKDIKNVLAVLGLSLTAIYRDLRSSTAIAWGIGTGYA